MLTEGMLSNGITRNLGRVIISAENYAVLFLRERREKKIPPELVRGDARFWAKKKNASAAVEHRKGKPERSPMNDGLLMTP